MVLEAMPNYNHLFNYMTYETLNATHCEYHFSTRERPEISHGGSTLPQGGFPTQVRTKERVHVGVQGKKKRRRRAKICKNKEEAETQRINHIAVERNRWKQMNEHLALLRSLMPESYSLRGDQATIVGGAVQYVKELEQMVHSLEAQKLRSHDTHTAIPVTQLTPDIDDYQHGSNKFTLKSSSAAADVEVTLIETHANLRILSKKNPRQLSKLVSGFQSLRLTILHLSVTTLEPLVLYSFSVKVEEG